MTVMHTLTDKQNTIKNTVLNDVRGAHIIRGHAGTGKTALLCNIIDTLIQQGKTVHVLAPTSAALSVLEDRLPTSNLIRFRTVAAVTQTPQQVLSLGDSAPSFPLTGDGLTRFASFMDALTLPHSDLVTAYDTAIDTTTPVNCSTPHAVLGGRKKLIRVDTDLLNARLHTYFNGTSPFRCSITTRADYLTPGRSATKIADMGAGFPDVVVVDEFSMVNSAEADILIRAVANRGGLFLASGDPYQLEPVTGEVNPYIRSDEGAHDTFTTHTLTTVLRSDDMVSMLANRVRQGTRLVDLAIAGDIQRVDSPQPEELVATYPELFTTADVVVTFRNAVVDVFNTLMRSLHGLTGAVQPTDRLVCNANVHDAHGFAFRNGEIIDVVNTGQTIPGIARDLGWIRHRASAQNGGVLAQFLSFIEAGVIIGAEVTNRAGTSKTAFVWADPGTVDADTHALFAGVINRLHTEGIIEACLIDTSFAHALTVHKAQGSEWGNVVYVATQNELDMQRTSNAPYTAISRAKHAVTVLYSTQRIVTR